MNSDYTRVGARRSGDDYQDIIAIGVLVDMLADPDKYDYVVLEAHEEARWLDDIVAVQSDGLVTAKQVKFSTDPTSEADPLTWKDLLHQEPGKLKLLNSSLQKWHKSIQKLREAPAFSAEIISNRLPGQDLAETLSTDGYVQYDLVPSDIQSIIEEQVGSESDARLLLDGLAFQLDNPGLDLCEQTAYKRFQSLGGTHEGWLNLKNEVRSWVCHKTAPPPDGRIRVDHVKFAAMWRKLESLPQDFEIPPGYVLPSKAFHKGMVRRIVSANKGCLLIKGYPGVGKSTYLSYLYSRLHRLGIPVVRHHYFLSLSQQSVGRFDHRTIADSLMHDIRASYKESLGYLDMENPNPNYLGKWVSASATYFKERGKCLVVIIDGLDHVWREKHSVDELASLLEHFLPIQEGVILLLGTQPLSDEQTPHRLVAAAPEIYELPFLDKVAVGKWVDYHKDDMSLPEDEQRSSVILKQIKEAMFGRSEGHPLHLVYTLRALLEQDIPVRAENIKRLPGCLHSDIDTYHKTLWTALGEKAQEILHLFAACRFPWQPQWIIECLDPHGLDRANRNAAVKQVRHLLIDRGLGLLPFHGSLLVFIQARAEHATYSASMKELAITWLSDHAPDYWKWAYLWDLEANIGDDGGILNGPSREWVLRSMENAYPDGLAGEMLSRGTWIALAKGDLPRSVEIGLLNDYLFNTYEFRKDVIGQLLCPQLFIGEDPYLMHRLQTVLSDLSHIQLFHIANWAAEHDDIRLLDKCRRMLYRKIFEDSVDVGYAQSEWRPFAEAYLRIAAYDNDPEPALGFIFANREYNHASWMLSAFAEGLLCARNTMAMRKVLRADLRPSERALVLDYAVLLAFHERTDITDEFTPDDLSLPLIIVYALVSGHCVGSGAKTAFPDTDWLQTPEYELYKQAEVVQRGCRQVFFACLANHLSGDPSANKAWLSGIGADLWSGQFLRKLNDLAESIASRLQEGLPLTLAWLYQQVTGLSVPGFSDGRGDYQYGKYAVAMMNNLALDLLDFNKDARWRVISKDDIEEAFRSDYCNPILWMNAYLSRREPQLSTEALDWLVSSQDQELRALISEFSERSAQYATLAGIATLHGSKELASRFIRQCVDNLLTYGGHKDMMLFGVLDGLQACHKAGVTEARDGLIELAPVIASIEEFTDRDETGALPRELGEALIVVAPDFLPEYHSWLLRKEEYYDALSVFNSFVKSTDLTDPTNRAIGLTAIDDESIFFLADRAQTGDVGAVEVFARTKSRLGHDDQSISRLREMLDRSSGSSLPEKSFPVPNSFPPGKLDEYIRASGEERSYWQKDAVEQWLNYWIRQGRLAVIYNDLERLLALGYDLGNEDILFDLVRQLFGADQAYPWLVKANREGHGWSRYWTSKEQAVRRWEIVKEYYPDRWYQFLVDTSISDRDVPWHRVYFHERFDRLVEYCLFMEQIELAAQIMRKVLDVTHELVSPLSLPIPEWVTDDD